MEYRHKVFLTVTEHLSFSKAAHVLYISQPAVTKHIKELESQLGIGLFKRVGSKIYLTPAGEVTYHFMKQIAQLYGELDSTLGTLKNEFKGMLRIGASSTISQYVVPGVLAAYHKKYPHIDLHLINGNSFDMEHKLLEGKIDLALVENDSSQINLKYTRFLEDEIVPIVSRKSIFYNQQAIDLSDLKHIPIVLRERGSGTLEVIERALTKTEVKIDELKILLHLGSTEAIKSFLINFEGIALVSERAIEKEIQLNMLKRLIIRNLSIKRHFRIAALTGPELTLPATFTQFLLSYNF